MRWLHGRLPWALLVSTVTHAGVLVLWPAPVAPLSGALSVTFLPEPLPPRGSDAPSGDALAASSPRPELLNPPAVVSPAPASQPALAAPAGAPSAPVMVSPVPAQGPTAVATPATARAPLPPPATTGTGPAPAGAPAIPEAVPSAPHAVAPPSGGTMGDAAAVGGAIGSADQDLYRGTLARHARRLKRYPPLARERGWQGTVEIEVSAHHGAAGPLFRVQRSSGYALLDQQALELMAQAARLVVLPDSLRRTGFRFVVPVAYRFDD